MSGAKFAAIRRVLGKPLGAAVLCALAACAALVMHGPTPAVAEDKTVELKRMFPLFRWSTVRG